MTLHLLEAGSGRPIVLVHGWPTNSTAWQSQLAALSPRHHVLAVDLPGFGSSPPLARPTMAALAAGVRDLLDERQLEDVLLIGWSMGGCVTFDYLRQFGPHRLRAIGIVDVSPCLLPQPGWAHGEGTPFDAAGLAAWSSPWATDSEAVVRDVYTIGLADPVRHVAELEWLVQESLRADHATAMLALLDAFEQDYRPLLPTIDVPALLLYGAHSTSSTPYLRDYLARTIPKARLEVFADSSHCLMIEEAERFNRVVGAFADET